MDTLSKFLDYLFVYLAALTCYIVLFDGTKVGVFSRSDKNLTCIKPKICHFIDLNQ